ncbi:MAG TPA: hypothetical protein VM510_17675 [Caulifigura sp.]|nr:hypothetical protein [Caulifigura sp.]
MNKSKGPAALAVLIITVGVGWLLTVRNVMPGINWIWTLSLFIVGLLTFIITKGIDRVSVIVGPFFVIASLLSTLRQTGRLAFDTEVPLLVIVSGVLLLIAQSRWIRTPEWLLPSTTRHTT